MPLRHSLGSLIMWACCWGVSLGRPWLAMVGQVAGVDDKRFVTQSSFDKDS